MSRLWLGGWKSVHGKATRGETYHLYLKLLYVKTMVTLSDQLSHLKTWKPHAAETMQGNWFSYCLTWHRSLSESPTTHARGKGTFDRSCQSSKGVLSPKKPKQICKEALTVTISFITPDLTKFTLVYYSRPRQSLSVTAQKIQGQSANSGSSFPGVYEVLGSIPSTAEWLNHYGNQ